MPQTEVERLARLHNLAVLDSGAEDFFDALVQAAAEVTGMPISLISLIDRDRQWFKANFGLPGVTETPRELAFCDHVVRGGAPVEVADAHHDPRFADNPLVTGDPNIRAYTGVPLTLSDGTRLGTLCVIDREPRALRPEQLRVLSHLAAAASMALEQRGDLIHQREVVRAEALAVEASERRYRKLFQYSLGLICTHNLQGDMLSVNPAAAASLGYDMGAMLGVNLREFMLPERRPQLDRYLHRIKTERIAMGILELVASDGTLRYWRYQNVLDEDAEEPYVLGHAQDVTEQRRYENTLVEWSTRDPLTHAMNRRYLAQLEQRAAHDGPWGCIVVDLDHFKAINDTYGHARGDETLVAVAQQLRDHAGPRDVVVRMGGDEFLVVVDKAADVTRVMDALEYSLRTSPWSLSLGSSVSEPGDTVDQVIARADDQLYAHRSVARRGSR